MYRQQWLQLRTQVGSFIVMSANRQVEKGSLIYANPLLKVLYVLVADMTDWVFQSVCRR